MSAKEPSAFRLAATLCIAGLLSGLVLAGVFAGTKGLIDDNKAEELSKAILEVLPGTVSYATMVIEGDALVVHQSEKKPEDGTAVYAGKDENGRFVGYAVEGAGPGFMDRIGLIFGYDPKSQVIVGMKVLESKETPGLGDKIIKDDDFLSNFEALAVEPEIKGVKKGEKSQPNEVDCITGATISSKAVISILNNGTQKWLPVFVNAEVPEE
jgi:electron transport complex protein RnfG